MAMNMGRTARGGPAHKIKAYGARLWSACTARQLEDILVMKEDLFDMIDIVFLVNTYHIAK